MYVAVSGALNWRKGDEGDGVRVPNERGEAVRVCGNDFDSPTLESLSTFDAARALFAETDRPRLSVFSTVRDEGDRRRLPKSDLGDHCDFSFLGESERVDLCFTRIDDDV